MKNTTKGKILAKPAIKKILLFILSFSILIIFSLWAWINYIFIPRVVIPNLREYIAANEGDLIKFTIKDITFHPTRGFLLHDIELLGPVVLTENYILRAKTIDIDIAFAPLLRKQILVKKMSMYGVDLNIGRDASGTWNFIPLLESDIVKNIELGEYDFVMREFKVKNSDIYYSDYFKKDNMLKRHLTKVDLSLILDGQFYKLIMSGGAKDKREEYFKLGICYNREQEAVEGTAQLNTRHLNEYWDYYLDDIFKPWHLKASEIKAFLQFSYLNEKLTMKNSYSINDGTLTYGDLTIKGEASVIQNGVYAKDIPAENITTADVSLSSGSLLMGGEMFLDKGGCKALISNKEITFEAISGEIAQLPVSLSGKFTFSEPRQLYLVGKMGESDNTFYLKFLTDNRCISDWDSKKKNSYLKLHVDIPDLKNLDFNLTAEGNVQFSDMNKIIAGSETIKGRMKVTADVKGEADKLESFDGKAVIAVDSFSFLGLEAISFEFDLDAKDGLFSGKIPRTEFCGGDFSGEVRATIDKLGVELDINQFDIQEFVQPAPRFKGAKGIVNGNIVFITNWADPSNAVGGGYIKAIDCDIKNLPLFLSAEEGIGSVTKNASFQMPVFKKIEGNYEIKNKGLNLENISCNAAGLGLILSGGFTFLGAVDITIDARFLGSGLFRTARQVLLPETIGLDLIADSIVVKIEGKWSELKQRTTLQPIRSLWSSLSPFESSANPDKYSLDKLWS